MTNREANMSGFGPFWPPNAQEAAAQAPNRTFGSRPHSCQHEEPPNDNHRPLSLKQSLQDYHLSPSSHEKSYERAAPDRHSCEEDHKGALCTTVCRVVPQCKEKSLALCAANSEGVPPAFQGCVSENDMYVMAERMGVALTELRLANRIATPPREHRRVFNEIFF